MRSGPASGENLSRAIETASLRAWPAIEEVDLDGWKLRFSDGFTGRANSVQTIDCAPGSVEQSVESCERWYEDRGRPSLFRLTPFSQPGLDDLLAHRGYERHNRTLVLRRDTSGLPPLRDELELAEIELHDWLRTYAGFSGSPAAPAPMRRIIERIEGCALCGLLRTLQPRRAVACGLAVSDGEFLGLFDVVVDPGLRRAGYGEELVRRLVTWGRRGGAECVYLQVTEDNAPALSLYAKLGFRPAYEYWYRIRRPRSGAD